MTGAGTGNPIEKGRDVSNPFQGLRKPGARPVAPKGAGVVRRASTGPAPPPLRKPGTIARAPEVPRAISTPENPHPAPVPIRTAAVFAVHPESAPPVVLVMDPATDMAAVLEHCRRRWERFTIQQVSTGEFTVASVLPYGYGSRDPRAWDQDGAPADNLSLSTFAVGSVRRPEGPYDPEPKEPPQPGLPLTGGGPFKSLAEALDRAPVSEKEGRIYQINADGRAVMLFRRKNSRWVPVGE